MDSYFNTFFNFIGAKEANQRSTCKLKDIFQNNLQECINLNKGFFSMKCKKINMEIYVKKIAYLTVFKNEIIFLFLAFLYRVCLFRNVSASSATHCILW